MREKYVNTVNNIYNENRTTSSLINPLRATYGKGLPNGFKIIFQFTNNRSNLLIPVPNYRNDTKEVKGMLFGKKSVIIKKFNAQNYYLIEIPPYFKTLLYRIYTGKIFNSEQNTKNFKNKMNKYLKNNEK